MPPRLSCPGGWNSLLTGCRLKWPKGSGRNPMRIFFILLLWAAGSWTVWAAEPGEAAVVIYNAQMPESKDVADHYAERRGVPANQIIGLNLPTGETMTRGEYQDLLQAPLLNFLRGQKLIVFDSAQKLERTTVRYAVLCYGVPLRIAEDPSLSEPGEEKLAAPLHRNGCLLYTSPSPRDRQKS